MTHLTLATTFSLASEQGSGSTDGAKLSQPARATNEDLRTPWDRKSAEERSFGKLVRSQTLSSALFFAFTISAWSSTSKSPYSTERGAVRTGKGTKNHEAAFGFTMISLLRHTQGQQHAVK